MEGFRRCVGRWARCGTGLAAAALVCLASCARQSGSSVRDLKSPDPAVRAAAVWQAGQRGDRQQAGELVERLRDDDPVVRMAADEALQKLSGKEFGFRSWAPSEERTRAVAQWQAWVDAGSADTPRVSGERAEVGQAESSEQIHNEVRPAESDSAIHESGGRFSASDSHVEKDSQR